MYARADDARSRRGRARCTRVDSPLPRRRTCVANSAESLRSVDPIARSGEEQSLSTYTHNLGQGSDSQFSVIAMRFASRLRAPS